MCYNTILTKEQILKGIEDISLRIQEIYKNTKFSLLCVLNGGIYFLVDLTRTMPLNLNFDIHFVSISSYTNNEQKEIVKIEFLSKEKLNENIIIIDELFDTGNTLKHLTEYLISQGYSKDKIKGVCLMRKDKVSENLGYLSYYIFDVPNKWLVGYGLDDNNLNRHLFDIVEKID